MNPALLGIVSALSWGCLDLIASLSSRTIGALATVAGVTVGGFLILTLYLMASGEPIPPLWGQGTAAAYASGALIALASLFLFAAFAAGPIAVVSPIVSSYPLTSMILAALTGTIPSAASLAAAMVVIAGVMIVARTEPGDARFAQGAGRCIAYSLLSHVGWALAIFAGQYATAGHGEGGHHAAVGTAWLGRIAGLATLLPVVIAAPARISMPPRWMGLFLVAGCLDVLGIVFINAAASSAHPVVATVAASCFGVVTILLARVILREAIPPLRWAGIAVTFGGVAALVLLSGAP